MTTTFVFLSCSFSKHLRCPKVSHMMATGGLGEGVVRLQRGDPASWGIPKMLSTSLWESMMLVGLMAWISIAAYCSLYSSLYHSIALYLSLYVYIYIYVYIYMCVCVWLHHVYIYIYTHRLHTIPYYIPHYIPWFLDEWRNSVDISRGPRPPNLQGSCFLHAEQESRKANDGSFYTFDEFAES